MSRDLSEEEIKNNLEFLNSKLPTRPTAIDGLYKLPREFWSEVIGTDFSQQSLQRISDHIGYFLGIVKSIQVTFVEDSTDYRWGLGNWDNPSVTGLYKAVGYDHGEILLIKKAKYKLKHVLAILAHEYTHHYLYQHNVKKNDTDENEILTDLAAAYLGLGHFLVDGYEPIIWKSNYYNYIFVSGYTTNKIVLGYVTSRTITKAIILSAELRKWHPGEVVSSFSSFFDKIMVYLELWPYRREFERRDGGRNKS